MRWVRHRTRGAERTKAGCRTRASGPRHRSTPACDALYLAHLAGIGHCIWGRDDPLHDHQEVNPDHVNGSATGSINFITFLVTAVLGPMFAFSIGESLGLTGTDATWSRISVTPVCSGSVPSFWHCLCRSCCVKRGMPSISPVLVQATHDCSAWLSLSDTIVSVPTAFRGWRPPYFRSFDL